MTTATAAPLVLPPPLRVTLSPEVIAQVMEAAKAAPPAPAPTPVAVQGAALSGLTSFKAVGLPVGEMVVGGVGGYFATRALQRVLPSFAGAWTPLVVGLGAAWILLKWGDKLLGHEGAKAAAIVAGASGFLAAVPQVPATLDRFVSFIPSIGGRGIAPGMPAVQSQGGGSAVVNRLASTNI